MILDIKKKTNALIEDSKMVQNSFFHLLIQIKLRPIFENWSRNENIQGITLSLIQEMDPWIHNLQQFWIDKASSNNTRDKWMYEKIAEKIMETDDNGRLQIDEKAADSTLSVKMLKNENSLINQSNYLNWENYKEHLRKAKDNRNTFSHYTPITSLESKFSDLQVFLNDFEDFVNYMSDDLTYFEQDTDCLNVISREIEKLRFDLSDLIGEKETQISQLSKIRNYVNHIKGDFENFIEKYVDLDISEEELLTYFSDVYIDEIIQEERIIPRRGKLDEILPTIENKKMILIGSPGAGKTTGLSYLAYLDAKKYVCMSSGDKVPILLKLNTLYAENITVLKKISEEINCTEDELSLMLAQGNVKIYLDGLNEIPNQAESDAKQRRITEIRELAERYSEILFVISTREADAEYFKYFPCFRIMPMSFDLMKEFIYKNVSDEISRAILLAEISKKTGLMRRIKSPLYLTRLISVVNATHTIPKNEGEIIGEYLNSLLNRERYDKAVVFDKQLVLDILTEFAYFVREKYGTNAPVKRATIIRILANTELFPKDKISETLNLCLNLEILVMDKHDCSRYYFAHETYQEYFRAQKDDFCL